ncbi:MalY/PatB family protein [Coprobacter tertius]|uniref:cysteine-S-conjugate beta-lyase n=1 Tax=Coprobacter tertius TaxID=2944915 RepID=A0ABT1MLC1_9BACT|nr:PatB family C-S lyase [Coprobacter tertius]MCP9612503.1 PatB family C-S lyase [Coprobacter tertius]
MKYDFDEVIDRRHTHAIKTDALLPRWGRDDLIPLWVADMDFRTPPFVMDALRKRCEHEILGYTTPGEDYYRAIENWVDSRFGWKIQKDEILFCPGVVPGITFSVLSMTQPGDKVLIQPPVYHPFRWVVEQNGREVVTNPLILENGIYRMDTDHFKKVVSDCKLFILCNPHNPGGIVWDVETLKEIAEICYENGTIVVSDEIHADLTLPPYKHHPFATVSEKARMNSITFMSPSKAFNMAGLGSAYSIIINKNIRDCYRRFVDGGELAEGHIFAYPSVVAAYSNGVEWLNECLSYIQKNIDFTIDFCRDNMPKIVPVRPHASYLVFLDCRDLDLSHNDLINLFVEGAHLALNDGAIFGHEGDGFMRLNVATPRTVLAKALHQLRDAYIKI